MFGRKNRAAVVVGLAVTAIVFLSVGSRAFAGASLAAPQEVRITAAADDRVVVAWAPVSGAVGYDVYVDGAKWAWSRGENNTTAELRWLEPGQPIEIAVQAVRDRDTRSETTTIGAVPGGVAAPGGVEAEPAETEIELSWLAVPDERVVSYDVWSRTPGDENWRWSTWNRGTTTIVTGLERGETQELMVTAKTVPYADLGEPTSTLPEHATVITVTTLAPAPPVPTRLAPVTDLEVAETTDGTVTVTWSAAADDRRRSFDLFVDQRWAGWISDPAATTHTFNNLDPDTTYSLGVTAVGDPADDWNGPHYSERRTIQATTAAAPIEPPPVEPPPVDPPPVEPPPGDGIGDSEACRNSTETACVEWPHGFVRAGTDQLLAVNGVNILDWFSDNGWRYDVDQLAEPGAPAFDTIRLVISWAQMQRLPGMSDPTSMAALDAMIADAAANGFAVILDPIHTGKTRSYQWELQPGSAWNMPAWAWEEAGIPPATSRDQQTEPRYNCGAGDVIAGDSAYRWLAEVVERYADNDDVIAIDLVNEPRNSCWGEAGQPTNATAAAQELVDLQVGWIERLRALDNDKVLIATPMYGDFDTGRLDLGRLAVQSNVMWTVHDYYAGYSPDGTFYRSSGLVNTGAERSEICNDSCYGYDRASRAERQASMAAYVELHLDALARWQLPVFIGEYGYHGTVANHADALADKYELYESYGLARTAWVANYDAAFQLYSSAGWHPNADELTGGAVRP